MTDAGATLKPDARIGIVNRGEAAVRFIRAAREYNATHGTELRTVALYIDSEEEAVFVQESDEAISLTKLRNTIPGSGSVYLDQPLLMHALAAAECTAVWVGWGFVSEDAQFVERVEQAGLAFLGPPSRAMAMLGDKIAAKDLAKTANVPILPWSEGPVRGLDEAHRMAKQIGYPCIVKAANAGGGRGIRFVRTPEELEAQYTSARDETVRITGNDIVFMERLVEVGRHLEVQTIADRHGNVQTFGVRDCSVQRRNQKIIEETPPPQLTPEQREAIEAAAARLVSAAAYESAGTVEFLYDVKTEEFYFMEVNTRLQVEHPITEQRYGIDLVQGQIDVAFGHELSAAESEPRGSAIEVRLNAEDPDREFTPCPGRVTVFRAPAGPGIRVDSGIQQGSVIPPDFDSMVAKIIAYGPTRKATIGRLRRALQEMRIRIEGGTTNRAFLLRLLDTDEIVGGAVHTRFVEELLARDEEVIARPDWDLALAACAAEKYLDGDAADLVNFKQQLSSSGSPRDIRPSSGREITLKAHGVPHQYHIKSVGNSYFHLRNGDETVCFRYWRRETDCMLACNGRQHRVQIVVRGDTLQCEIDAVPYPLEVESSGFVRAPSPAIALAVHVGPGQRVAKDELLVTLEAMKMEMIVSAPEAGTVQDVFVKSGEQIAAGAPLVRLEAGEAREQAAEETGARIAFREHLVADAEQWDRYAREYRASFLGYDHEPDPMKALDRMVDFAQDNPAYDDRLYEEMADGVRMYASIEQLFSGTPLSAPGVARPASSQELLSHYIRREVDRAKGLPEAFVEELQAALTWYPETEDGDNESEREALFRMYRSHSELSMKKDLLQRTLFLLEQWEIPEDQRDELSNVLDQVVLLTQLQHRAIADAAIHARYQLIDRQVLHTLKAEKRAKVERLLDLITTHRNRSPILERLRNYSVNAGHHVLPDLSKAALSAGSEPPDERQRLAHEILARRFTRDRTGFSGRMVTEGPEHWYVASTESNEGRHNTIVTAAWPDEVPARLEALAQSIAGFEEPPEVVVLVSSERAVADAQDLTRVLEGASLSCVWLSAGVFDVDGSQQFRTFVPGEDGTLHEDPAIYNLNPIQRRELRIDRFALFELKQVYSGSNAWVLNAVARDNPRDERLFALVEVPTARVEFDEDGSIRRMIALENVLMEAVYAMRAHQARRKRRLYWNRIILHVRTVMHTTLDQIRDYAGRLAARASDLGVEKLVLYSRRPRPGTEGSEEVELLFENISGTNFTLRGRTPTTEPLKPMDAYVAKVVRARQRSTIYPYEVIKMLTRAGYPVFETLPRGEFEEFDIQRDGETGEYRPVSVKGRPYGENQGNIVFGTITNCLSTHSEGVKRVIILSDPTKDMGALAEDECRRVNAALDIAEELGIPVEWLPISAGARIDMASGTENLDWTAATLRRIIEFTQAGGELNVIVSGINVGAQSYWNAEATMLMHTRGLLIMTEDAAMLLTGKKALDFSGGVSAENNIGIGGLERIMGPNGEAQIGARSLYEAFTILFRHYSLTYATRSDVFPKRVDTRDPEQRSVAEAPYEDTLGQGFATVGDIFSTQKNPERKKPFDMRQVMRAVTDVDVEPLERWSAMRDAETAVVWETRIGGYAAGLIGIESKSLARIGEVPHDGPESWSGGTLFPLSSKKVARGINAFSGRLPAVILANLSGFDGSPESLRKLQLEYGAEIGRAVVNFRGPIVFVVTARYHGGAYVVFSKSLHPSLHAAAVEGAYASVIGGAPAAAVVFPGQVMKETYADSRIVDAQRALRQEGGISQHEFDELFQQVHREKQQALAQRFDSIHSVERAREVGSIDAIVRPDALRPYLIQRIAEGMQRYRAGLSE